MRGCEINANPRLAGLPDFSRKQIVDPKTLDLNPKVRDISEMLTRLVGEHIELRTSLAADLRKVRIDPVQVEQIVLNLVVNTRDAMPDGGKILIETQNAQLDETYCRTHAYAQPGSYVKSIAREASAAPAATFKRAYRRSGY